MKKVFFILISAFLLVFSSFYYVTHAEEISYQTLLTWQAENLYPADYQGKPLATEGSPVRVSAELLKNGAVVDISKTPIKWYVDKKYFDGGVGVKQISFAASLPAGESHVIKTSIQIDGKTINGFLEVPVSESDLVIKVNAPNNKVKPNSSALFTAVPYFFNISSIGDLGFLWNVQNQPVPSETSQKLLVQFGEPKSEDQREIKIGASVSQDVFTTIKRSLVIRVE